MARIKLYRGGQTASLPQTLEDGAVYILAGSNNKGTMYVDTDNQRVQIMGGIIVRTTEEWRQNLTAVSEAGVLYVFSDARSYVDSNTGDTVTVPGIKVGDGTTYIVDLPFVNITGEQINFWNNKVNCYLEPDLNQLIESEEPGDSENLIFTRLY